ncbi:MAG: protein kinase [Candidatus Obscuribacterales bacterium]|nr:protein kinase [Candidatus Obscuribacterales bacterium]
MPQDFGIYQVQEEIGRGGMGIIYKATDPRLNRAVAIKKLILDHVDPDKKDEFRERFRREAILAAGLNHPNLISIYDVNIGPDHAYYVMELLQGHSLRQELEQKGKLTPLDLFAVVQQVCQGLAYAHDMGLVHRDIKPDNIFILPGGKVKVTDFGIARGADNSDSTLTKPGVMLGTLAYVSPEQLQDARHVDHRADIYSLSVCCYEALAGAVPFAGDGLTATLMAIISKPERPLNEVNPEISADVAAVVAKGMRKKAPDRFASLVEFEKEFERAIGIRNPAAPASRSTGVHPGSSAGSASGTPPPVAYTPGLPVGGSVKLGGNRHHQPTGDEIPKASVKPWLSGRTGEAAKPSAGQPITQSVQLVKAVATFGRQGEDRGCFMEPTCISARTGKIVVGDGVMRYFQMFSKEGRYQGESRPNSTLKGMVTFGRFSKPISVDIDSRNRIYGVDSSDHYIRIFDAQGNFVREFVNKHGKDGGLAYVLCDNPSGQILVSDLDNGCVQVFSMETGAWVRKIGSKGNGDGQLQLPAGLALDRFGQLYVVDYGASRVSVFSKSGMFVKSFGSKGSSRGEFNVPRGVAIDMNDRIYIADSLNHRVCVFTTGGDYMFSFGGKGMELGKFTGPADISIDPESNVLYVVDKGNCRVQVFEILAG